MMVDAVHARGKLRTSQLALPQAVCRKVYGTSGYDGSLADLAHTSLKTDVVFSDGWSLQMATLTGDPSTGPTATLGVPV